LPNLSSLTLLLRIEPLRERRGNCFGDRLHRFLDALETKHVLLKARKVKVRIRVGCALAPHLCKSNLRCKKIVEAALKDVVMRVEKIA